MQIKSANYKIKGMNQDLSYSAFNPEFSWENKNIRLTARDSNNLMSITNERGTLNVLLKANGSGSNENVITDNVVGSCVINNKLVLFTYNNNNNLSYKNRIILVYDSNITSSNDTYSATASYKILYTGNLEYTDLNTIETLPFYENELIQKVYWIDGINQPRVINIASTTITSTNFDTQFDFIQQLQLNESVSIDKLDSGGQFKSGIIQYAFTYFNSNGCESNIFHISPLYYISPSDRGGKSDEIINNSFRINVSNLDNNFEYIRIYSIQRTSLDIIPEVKNIIDINIESLSSISFIDTNSIGSVVDSQLLYYIGGEEIIPQTICQKNNKLFLGNLELKTKSINKNSLINAYDYEFSWKNNIYKEIENCNENSYYSYKPNSLNGNAFSNTISRHFKYDETYRLGIQGQYSNGKWSTPIYLGEDKYVNKRYDSIINPISTNSILLAGVYGELLLNSDTVTWLKSEKFIKIRPIYVPLSYADRTIFAQGLVSNTLGIVKNRYNRKDSMPFAYPDYLLRTNGKKLNDTERYNGQYSHLDLLKLNNHLYSDGQTPSKYIENMANGDSSDYKSVFDFGIDYNGNQQTNGSLDKNFNRDFFFVDRNLVNFWSPEIIYNYETINSYIKSTTKIGLYGFAVKTSSIFNFNVESGDSVNWGEINGESPVSFNVLNKNYIHNSNLDNHNKKLWSRIVSDGDPSRPDLTTINHTFPMWSPQNYHWSVTQPCPDTHGLSVTIDFTKINRSGFEYFGLNYILKDNLSYELDINTPTILYDDTTKYIQSNISDNEINNGNVLYSKNVEKNYTTENIFNTLLTHRTGGVDGPGNPSTDLEYTGYYWYWKDTIVDGGYKHGSFPLSNGMSVKYNTNSHALLSIKDSNNENCIPRLSKLNESTSINPYYYTEGVPNPTFYRGGSRGFNWRVIDNNYWTKTQSNVSKDNTAVNTLPIFDLYKDVYNKYGGTTPDALQSNYWVPCGNPITIGNNTTLTINYDYGDTFIQRFDFLRVYPNDITSVTQHTEIVSFLCESFMNLDGRSDINRYTTDSSMMTINNYGLLNKIYSQNDNYFTYSWLDLKRFKSNLFSNMITWTKTKTSGELVDTWTNITLVSTLDVDGVNGPISSINLFNNNLYVFQPLAVARLLYNEKSQSLAADGLSVELSNGYTVPDYRYISNQNGCDNKLSIKETNNGIVFIDKINKAIMLLGTSQYGSEQFKDLSLELGFKSWSNNNILNDTFIVSYDKINNDVYIHNKTKCICYSEITGTFTSFFDYVNIPEMKNIWNNYISLYNNSVNNTFSVNINNLGDYNVFYGASNPFYVKYLFNSDPLNDKVFNTIEYRLDNVYANVDTHNTINASEINWNEMYVDNQYQSASFNTNEFELDNKRKFEVYRSNFPRALDVSSRPLNRIRSTWAFMKLQYNPTPTNKNAKLSMQDLTVIYTV